MMLLVPELLGVWENLQGRKNAFMITSSSKETLKMKEHTRCIIFFLKKNLTKQ